MSCVQLAALAMSPRRHKIAANDAFMRQLKAYQITTGKADGWIAHKYRAKFGVWPNDPRMKFCTPAASVSPEVRSWLKSQAIRYAKSREKTGATA